ncbi:hypothetical protein BG015_008995 [Linnemannia schmuckeri]|uniref:Uncharacterized protein n=1 Tax=Linnemannia schmuckeri TaxID=64567 RepID=A0A9P5VA37_9FUNG|nr:hypothetical protein BG015_008995 [Linnemannia schmuckeri]
MTAAKGQTGVSKGSLGDSLADIDNWIRTKRPGFIIKNSVCNIAPQGLSNRQKRKSGHQGSMRLLTLDETRQHIELVRNTTPTDYQKTGYVAREPIHSDGFRVQILAFKLRERQDTRYKKRVDYFSPEILNIIKTPQDIQRHWPGKTVENMRNLTINTGQARVVGAFAYLPKEMAELEEKEVEKEGSDMDGVVITGQEPGRAPITNLDAFWPAQTSTATFLNLVESKAVYQPVFRFRKWVEDEKRMIPEGEESFISDIETRLPALRGPGTSVVNYVAELKQVEDRPKELYAGGDDR